MRQRDPKLRPYRAAMWVTYFVALLLGIGLFTGSVMRNLRGPDRPPRTAGPLPTRAALRACMGDLEALYREQNERAWALGSELEQPDPIGRWVAWAKGWELRVDDLSDRCRLDQGSGQDSGARAELAGARDALLALHRVYAAQVNRFAQEKADLAQAAAEALAHAREAVGRAR